MKRIASVLMLLVLLAGLAGCNLVRNSYLSVTPHNAQHSEKSDAIMVESYGDLKNALIEQVEQHATQIQITTYSYAGNVETDLTKATNYIQKEYPLGAYAIDSLSSKLSRVASYYQIQIKISYSHTPSELEDISQVRMDKLDEALGQALQNSAKKLILSISAYHDTDFSAQCAKYAVQHPDQVMQTPEVEYKVWPDSGSMRIVELSFTYSQSQQNLQNMQKEVNAILSAADSYVRYGRTDTEKAELLYSFLAERFTYQVQTTDTPAYSMLCQGIADSQTYAQVFRLLCQRAGLVCYAVDGLKNGALYEWIILQLEGVYWHADPFGAELSAQRQMPLYTDAKMTGYVWDQTAFPACTGS